VNSSIFRTSTITESSSGLTQTAVTNTASSYLFSLADLDQAADFVSLFDQYRITAVRIMFEPISNAVQLLDPTVTAPGILYSVIDYDDANNLTSIAQARSFANCLEASPGKSVCRTFVPRMALAAYSGTFTSFANIAPHWIDTSNTGVQHYGVKVIVSPGLAGQTLLSKWIVKREYFIEFRNVR